MHRHGPAPAAVAVAATAAAVRRPFYLVNQESRLVLEIHGGLTVAGTHLEIGRIRPGKAMHQLWHIDPVTGMIRSMVNDWVLECKGIGGRVTIGPHINAPAQMWCHDGRKIINRMWPTECLEIRAGNIRDGADVILQRYENRPWQHWFLEYA